MDSLAAHAGPIEPTRTFFNAIRARNVSVFFITGRRDSQRDATLLNLDHAGFQGWTKLVTRPDNDTNHSIVPFKSGERAKIQAAGYTIIATIGDQQSDIDGGCRRMRLQAAQSVLFHRVIRVQAPRWGRT